MQGLSNAGKLKNVIGVDLDMTLLDDATGALHYDVLRYIVSLQKRLKLPVVLVTARPMWLDGAKESLRSSLESIRSVSGWSPDCVIAEFGLTTDVTIPTYKVESLRRRGLVPVLMIDDMPEVLHAMKREFKALPILAVRGKLEKLAV